MSITLFHIDAFSHQPFQGNPAAVCFSASALSSCLMQSLAAELNLSETAFIYPNGDHYHLRWFTPQREVDLCGHATLASAHALWSSQQADIDQPLRFQTRSGVLTAIQRHDLIELDFPKHEPTASSLPDDLKQALGIQSTPLYSGHFGEKRLIQLESEEEVHQLTPNFTALRTHRERGISITAESKRDDCDFISRYFAPWVGIDEDPVNGSSHCALTPFWQEKLNNKYQLIGYQASQRGGYLHLRSDTQRVYISGAAYTVSTGQLHIPIR